MSWSSESNYVYKDGKTALASYWARFSAEERLLRLIDDPWLMGNFRNRMGQFVPWLEMPNVIPVSFEELIGPKGGGDAALQRRLIWSLQLKLQIPGNPDAFAARVFNPRSLTFFAGQIGAWHGSFSPDVEKCYSALPQDFEAEFGYARSADGSIPIYSTRIDEFRRRKLSFSKADFSSIPMTMEYGFLGFNLVSFGGRVYALAQSLGALDMTTMSADELAVLPNAKTVDEVKHLAALSTLKPAEAAKVATSGNPEIPQLVGVHRGFNLVRYAGKVYGLRQSLGEIDLRDGAELLEQRHGPADFIIGESNGEIRARVDALEEFRGMQNLLLEKLKSLQDEMRQEFQMPQESVSTRAGESEARGARVAADLKKTADDLKKITEALKQTSEDLEQTKAIVHSHSRTLERLARSWPVRVLLHLSKDK